MLEGDERVSQEVQIIDKELVEAGLPCAVLASLSVSVFSFLFLFSYLRVYSCMKCVWRIIYLSVIRLKLVPFNKGMKLVLLIDLEGKVEHD